MSFWFCSIFPAEIVSYHGHIMDFWWLTDSTELSQTYTTLRSHGILSYHGYITDFRWLTDVTELSRIHGIFMEPRKFHKVMELYGCVTELSWTMEVTTVIWIKQKMMHKEWHLNLFSRTRVNTLILLLQKCTHIFSAKNISIFAIFQDRNFNIKLANNFVKFWTTGPCSLWYTSSICCHFKEYAGILVAQHSDKKAKQLKNQAD